MKIGRPQKSKTGKVTSFTITLTPEAGAKLETLCQRAGTNRSDVIERLLLAHGEVPERPKAENLAPLPARLAHLKQGRI